MEKSKWNRRPGREHASIFTCRTKLGAGTIFLRVDGMSKPRLLENLSVSQAGILERTELFVNEIGVVQNLHISR